MVAKQVKTAAQVATAAIAQRVPERMTATQLTMIDRMTSDEDDNRSLLFGQGQMISFHSKDTKCGKQSYYHYDIPPKVKLCRGLLQHEYTH